MVRVTGLILTFLILTSTPFMGVDFASAGDSTTGSCADLFSVRVRKVSTAFVRNGIVAIAYSDFNDGGMCRTNRGLEGLKSEGGKLMADVLYSPALKGKKALDAGMGDGRAVIEARAIGIEMIGLDIALKPEQKNAPYFIERDMRTSGLKDNEFDLVMSNYNLFYYPKIPLRLRTEALTELSRITKPGGMILIASYYPPTELVEPFLSNLDRRRNAEKFLTRFPELSIEATDIGGEGGITLLLRKAGASPIEPTF